MSNIVLGIHHVTCIAGDAQQNLDFYSGALGMRLVKKSVNQDAPDTYHLFYADGVGTPGSDLTFFPWPGMTPAVPGVGQVIEVAFDVAPGSLDYWCERLLARGIAVDDIEERFGERALPFRDPHTLHLALIESAAERVFVPWERSPVPVAHQIRGLHSVRLWEHSAAATGVLLTNTLGFAAQGEEDGWQRYGAEGGGAGKWVEIREMSGNVRGALGVGGVHHVAWRTADSEQEMALRTSIAATGLQPTNQIDRFWFKSVYFREPGGVLFELATDGPGFSVDEDPAHLGEALVLPPWLEAQRAQIEAALPPLTLPASA